MSNKGSGGGAAKSKQKKKKYQKKQLEPLRAGEVVITERAPLEDHEIAPELRLARRLAHNDVSVRERSVKVLRRWLAKREVVTETEMLKIFKGLFYCYWMSDKQKVQMELAQRIVDLTIPLPEPRLVLFVKTFYDTLIREWGGIDRIRMDKYMSFVRRMVNATFRYLQAKEWNHDIVKQVTDVLASSVLCGSRVEVRGLFLHLTDVYLSELCKVLTAGPPSIPFDSFQLMIAPFYTSLCSVIDKTLIRRVDDNLMQPLLNVCRGAESLPEDSPHAPLVAVFESHVEEFAAHMFQLASSPSTLEKHRPMLYKYHSDFKQCGSSAAPTLSSFAQSSSAPAPVEVAESKAEKKESKKAAAKAKAKAKTKATPPAPLPVPSSMDESNDDDDNDDSDIKAAVAAVATKGKRKQPASPTPDDDNKTNGNGAAVVHPPLDTFILKKLKQSFPPPAAAAATPVKSSPASAPSAAPVSKIPTLGGKPTTTSNKKSKTVHTPALPTAPPAAAAPTATVAHASSVPATPQTGRKKSVRFDEDKAKLEKVKEFNKLNPTSPGEHTTALLGKSPAKTNLKPATPVFARSKRVVISTPPSPHVAAAAAGFLSAQPRAEDYFINIGADDDNDE